MAVGQHRIEQCERYRLRAERGPRFRQRRAGDRAKAARLERLRQIGSNSLAIVDDEYCSHAALKIKTRPRQMSAATLLETTRSPHSRRAVPPQSTSDPHGES